MLKTVTSALILFVASASIASADSYISNFVREQKSSTRVDLGTVRADGNGVIEVYTYHRGRTGALIGSRAVRAGANTHVEFRIRHTGLDAIAILKVNGQVMDTQELRF